jgi:xanthine/uracil/vitamin C permease (AzgA family)
MSSNDRTSAFDVRLIIALLTGVYGLVTTVLGLGITSDEEIERSAGININLWAGIGMLVVSLLFIAWARLRPLRVPEHHAEEEETTPQ